MYGIVNQAIQGLIQENYGKEKWQLIKNKAGIQQDYFVSNESYDDDITFDLVASASEILEVDSIEILKAFGHYWILKTGNEKYGDLMKAGGTSFYEFIQNLPNFHGRIMLIYPNLNPPEFTVEIISEDELKLDYFSTRQGLTYFVVGLIEGIAKMFDTAVKISLLESSHKEVWHDMFLIKVLKK